MIEVIDSVGQIGIISDQPPEKLPNNAWSDGENIRFDGFTARVFTGERLIFDPPTVAPHSLFALTTSNDVARFVYAGLTRVFIMDGDVHTEITRISGNYNAVAGTAWTGGVLGGLLIINNGVDVPQAHVPSTVATKLIDLPDWPTNTLAQIVKPFKNFLVALDVTKGSTRHRQMVKWSHPADPGAVPATWDETDPAFDAGETVLAETDGAVIDCLPLRDTNIIYKSDSVWGMQFIGAPLVFRFFNIFNNTGILTKRCMVAFEGMHAFLSNEFDVFVHDGQTINSVAQDRHRNWLRDNIDPDNFNYVFLTTNPREKEVWICVPENDATPTSKALVWNWKKNTWSVRTLPGITGAATGLVVSTDFLPTWDTVVGTWGGQGESTWALIGALPPSEQLVMCGPDTPKLILVDQDNLNYAEVAVSTVLERTGVWAFSGAQDLQSVKFVRRVRFRTKAGGNPTSLTFRVSVTMDIDDAPVWVSTTVNSGTTAEISVFKRGRFLGLRVESSGASWSMHSVELDSDLSGMY